jgi:adenylate cyclase class 2
MLPSVARAATWLTYTGSVTAATSNRETEIKLRVEDKAALLRTLRRLGAKQIVPRTYESNTIYDTRASRLRARGQLLRVRVNRPSPSRPDARDRTEVLVTFKRGVRRASPARPASRPAGTARYKVREEIEFTVGAPRKAPGLVEGDLTSIFAALGLRPVFRYAKYRTTYTLPKLRRIVIEIDETPIGCYLELEGAPAAIDRAARQLGYLPRDYIIQSYAALYAAYCRRSRRKFADMLFTATKKIG